MSVIGEDVIERIVNVIVEKYRPFKIILFGSYASKKPREESDIDLLIIKDTPVRRIERFVEVKRMIYDAGFRVPLSPVVVTRKELEDRLEMGDDFIKDILTRGMVLYEEKTRH